MMIQPGIPGGVIHALTKVVKSLFENGHWIWAVLIIAAVVIYYWVKLVGESSPEKKDALPESDGDKEVERDGEAEATVVETVTQSLADDAGCLPCGHILQNGRYRITDYLSHGGFGNTYLAEDLLLHKPVAIKELYVRDICSRHASTWMVNIGVGQNEETFERLKRKFIKEAHRLQSLHSPYIIKVYNCFEENGTAYYSMDYIPGNSLAQVVQERGRMEESEVRQLLPGLLSALKQVHEAGLWHLDLKPANLMLKDASSVILIDFGASKQLSYKDGEQMASSSAMYYTSRFAPPEQISRNWKNIGAWTDIYALGATLFNLLLGYQPPHTDELLAEGMPTFPPGISEQMSHAIACMMQPNRNARPQSVEEVALLLGIAIPD